MKHVHSSVLRFALCILTSYDTHKKNAENTFRKYIFELRITLASVTLLPSV